MERGKRLRIWRAKAHVPWANLTLAACASGQIFTLWFSLIRFEGRPRQGQMRTRKQSTSLPVVGIIVQNRCVAVPDCLLAVVSDPLTRAMIVRSFETRRPSDQPLSSKGCLYRSRAICTFTGYSVGSAEAVGCTRRNGSWQSRRFLH